MRSLLSAVCVVAVAAFACPAFAGFTATSGLDTGVNVDPGNDGATPGTDSFSIMGGTFATYTPTSNAAPDPQLTAADLNYYRYDLIANVATAGGSSATYTGTYAIYYDLNLNGVNDDGLLVSGGTLTATANFFAPNNAHFDGFLTQTTGASNPAFGDLSYGGSPVSYSGDYVGLSFGDGSTATVQTTFVQAANPPVPEPATLGLLAMGLPALLLGRRRRSL